MIEHPPQSTFQAFKWNPRWGNLAPIVCWLAVGGILQLARLGGTAAPSLLEWLNPIADLVYLVVPILFCYRVEKESLAFLGVSRKRLWLGLIVGGGLGIIIGGITLVTAFFSGNPPSLPEFFEMSAYLVRVIFHVAAVELFYRGWVAARFEQSFGTLPAILVSGLLYALSPLFLWGTDPNTPAAYLSLTYYWSSRFYWFLTIGVFLAGLARFTRNLATSFLLVLITTVIGELMPGGPAHHVEYPGSTLIGTLALAGIVAVVLWMSCRSRKKTG
ncbi:CPBP family intramembrane metalloprotease [candidate division WOR-3 bacterium]|nr:CPBP family intramembrane metalloprotease [candidate division WOR-3 bacterium]